MVGEETWVRREIKADEPDRRANRRDTLKTSGETHHTHTTLPPPHPHIKRLVMT